MCIPASFLYISFNIYIIYFTSCAESRSEDGFVLYYMKLALETEYQSTRELIKPTFYSRIKDICTPERASVSKLQRCQKHDVGALNTKQQGQKEKRKKNWIRFGHMMALTTMVTLIFSNQEQRQGSTFSRDDHATNSLN